MKKLLLIIPVLALAGCTIAPLKGGRATTLSKPTQGIEQTVVQSDNPAAVSRQDQETVRTKTYTVPAGSRLVETRVTADAGGAPITNAQTMIISEPMPVSHRRDARPCCCAPEPPARIFPDNPRSWPSQPTRSDSCAA